LESQFLNYFFIRNNIGEKVAKQRNPAATWLSLLFMLILGCILVPIIVDQVQTVNTTGWAFTGVSGAKTLFNLIPFIFITGIVLYFILAMLGKT
jgi:hypothetical protein